MPVTVYLASGSPRRKEILQQIGVQFEVVSTPVEEIIKPDESPVSYVQRLALEKAQAGLDYIQRRGCNLGPVLGADTLGVVDQRILEKPKSYNEFVEMLTFMSNRVHQVITGVALVSPEKVFVNHSITEVKFRSLTEKEIHNYWLTGEPCDKAGGYAIQGKGAVFVNSIQGSYSNVVGLPIEVCCEAFRQFNIPWWDYPDAKASNT